MPYMIYYILNATKMLFDIMLLLKLTSQTFSTIFNIDSIIKYLVSNVQN